MAHESHLNPGSPPHVCLLLFPEVQLLDASPIDLFGMMTPTYLSACNLPAPLVASGTPWTITLASAQPAGSPSQLTANTSFTTTHALSDPAVAPGKVDVLLVPGPPPAYAPSDAEAAFLRAHAAAGARVLAVCTGVIAAARAGLLEGRTASGPRALAGQMAAEFRGVKWEARRWSVDGEVWTSGGITNGLEMVAAFLRAVYGGPVAETVVRMADVGDKGREYARSGGRDTAFVAWQIVRALVAGWFGGGRATAAADKAETNKQS